MEGDRETHSTSTEEVVDEKVEQEAEKPSRGEKQKSLNIAELKEMNISGLATVAKDLVGLVARRMGSI